MSGAALALALGGAAAPVRATPPRFSGERALALAVEFTALGPKVPGTKAHARGRDYLADQLRRAGARVECEEFAATGPSLLAPGTRLVNVVARFQPAAPTRVLLGAHWDSRPTADEDPDPRRRRDPVPGANDGASGVAVLLHLAELLGAEPAQVGVDIVLFDGEDAGIPDSLSTYCLGSREHVRRLRAPRPAYVIVVDMVGDRELALPVEGYSENYAPEIVRMVWGRAAALGFTEFHLERGVPIHDDHVPFLEAGIPAVDIIDFDYPPWHTVADTADKLSARSLEVVGTVLASLLYAP
jgi:hypothetical protein